MYEKLLNAVTTIASPKVLVVGDFLLDVYVYGDAIRISPEAPVPVLKVVEKKTCCGGAASVAADLAAMGAIPFCLGAIGNDDNGKQLCKKLTQQGCDISAMIKLEHRPTICKQRFIGLAQHKHRQQLIRVDEEVDGPLDEESYDRLSELYKQKLNDIDIICLQDYNKGLFRKDFCEKLIALAVKNKKKIIVDPAPGTDYAKYKNASVITPNRLEAALAVNSKIETIKQAAEAAKILKNKLAIDAIVITLDKDGAYLKTNEYNEHIPTVIRNVYDVSGAGDMVLAALATMIASGCDHKTAVEICNVAGGLEVEKFGTATVSADEILSEIIKRQQKSCSKLKTPENLARELNWHRSCKQKIVFTNGCFDVLHRGHIEYLNFCKKQGDIVVLGLNSDASVKKIKGPQRPINNQNDRAAVIAGLASVDYIVIFDEPDPLEIIKKIQPDLLIKGQDWADKGVIGREFVEANGGKVMLSPLVEGKSSTKTINKMKSLRINDK